MSSGEVFVRRFSIASLVAAALITTNAASAGAAVKVGETFTPDVQWGGTGVIIQVGAPGDINVVPTAGVLTGWSFEARAAVTTPPLKMKVVRPAGGNDFTTVADSQLQTPMPGVLNTWPTRIPVNAGDLLALHFSDDTYGMGFPPDPQYATQEISGVTGSACCDPPPGTAVTYDSPNTSERADISAMLEPDADHDGFGDESQDKCVGTPGTANGCPSTVTIDKLKQKGDTKVKVTATVPGAGTLKVGSPSDPALASAAAKKRLKAVTTTLTATTKQQLKLTLKLTKSAAAKLVNTGSLKLKVKAVYTPVGGPAGSQTKKKKLKS
jgi:hypothetical protein